MAEKCHFESMCQLILTLVISFNHSMGEKMNIFSIGPGLVLSMAIVW